MPFDELREECGVFGIAGSSDAAMSCILGLHSLQHRGQESFGIVTSGNKKFERYYSSGYVNSIFATKTALSGDFAIGHVRYSTSGDKDGGMQPFYLDSKFGEIAVAHNGNLINTDCLRADLISLGCIFQSDVDTELIIQAISMSKKSHFYEALIEVLKQIKGAYSLVILANGVMYGIRDPAGIRPLSLGKLGNSYVLASETCAFDIIGATFIRDVQPGEIVCCHAGTIESLFPFAYTKPSFCIFEYIYFSRPDSQIASKSIYDVRKKIGMQLAQESPPPKDADVVVPVPDSGVPAAIGYSRQSGLPFELGIIRNHYVGRTFIQPTDKIRHMGVKLKHNANPVVIKNNNVVLIDDSIVRGTTLAKIVKLLRSVGVKSVHLRISSPPTIGSCFYGVDTPDADKLMAVNLNLDEMRQALDVDSLCFLSIDGLYQAVCGEIRNKERPQYCDACFTNYYPIGKEEKNKAN